MTVVYNICLFISSFTGC